MQTRISSEKDVELKVVKPLLDKHGYKESDWTANFPIPTGRNKIYADFLISSDFNNLDNAVNLIIETKKPDVDLMSFIRQAISYGRLTKAKYSILINNLKYIVVDNGSQQVINESNTNETLNFLSKKEYFNKKNIITYGQSEIEIARKEAKIFSEVDEFSSKFEKCQDAIRNIDGKTGSDAFDELSKILFIKIFLEEHEPNSKVFSTKSINEFGVSIIKDTYFKKVKDKYNDIFKSDDHIELKDESIIEIVKILEPYTLKNTEIDVKGRAYEILLGKTFLGSLGQHFTPRTVVKFMIDMIDPTEKINSNFIPKIIDPACGSGGFLIEALMRMLKKADNLNLSNEQKDIIKQESLFGSDINDRLVRVAKMNMSLHGDGKGGIYQVNGLNGNDSINRHKYDFVITNPPFGTKTKDERILKKYTIKTKSSDNGVSGEILFVERCYNLLKDDGVLAILIPDGLINNKTTENVRKFINDNMEIDAIISLPDKTFKSANANAVTSIVFATKRKINKNKYIFMSLAEEIGFERKTKNARSINDNDLPYIYQQYSSYRSNLTMYNEMDDNIIELSRSPKSFLVKREYVSNSRIDATFYYSTYLYKNTFSYQSTKLKDYAKIVKRSLSDIEDEIPYIEFSSVVPQVGLITNYKMIDNTTRPGRAKYLLNYGDVIAARMRDSEENIAIVPKSLDKVLATNGFIILEPISPMTKECLYYLLVSEANLNQVRWKSSGTIMPTIDDKEYLKNWVPKLSVTEIENITSKIKPKLDKMFLSLEEIQNSIKTRLF